MTLNRLGAARFLMAALASAVLVSTHTAASPITVTFDNASDLARFNQEYASVPISLNTAGGIAGSGGIQASYNNATFSERSFDFTDNSDSVYVSLMFKPTALPYLQRQTSSDFAKIYLVPGPNNFQSSSPSAFVEFGRVNDGFGFVGERIFGGPLQVGGGSFPGFQQLIPDGLIASDHWYEFQVGFKNQGTSIGWDILINDFGADGTHFVANVLSLTKTTPLGIQPLTGDSSVFAGISLTGNQIYDNLRLDTAPIVAAIPEPGTLPLVALAVFSFIVSKRIRPRAA